MNPEIITLIVSVITLVGGYLLRHVDLPRVHGPKAPAPTPEGEPLGFGEGAILKAFRDFLEGRRAEAAKDILDALAKAGKQAQTPPAN